MKPFAQLLSRYVTTSGIKQNHLADAASISTNYLSRLLAGDRNPSEPVVYKLAEALHLSSEQTGALLTSAGYLPPVALAEGEGSHQQPLSLLPATHSTEVTPTMRLTQQFHRLVQEVPEAAQFAFAEEMKHLLGYARYKYVLCGADNLQELGVVTEPTGTSKQDPSRGRLHLDLLAQLVAELHASPDEEITAPKAEQYPSSPKVVEDLLSAIDQMTGNLLSGEVQEGPYQSHLIAKMFDLLQEGAPWEIRRRIAEALPGLCRLDAAEAEQLMGTLRTDYDPVRGADIRRRVIEALPVLFEVSPLALQRIVGFLQPRLNDDVYVALAAVEACGDLQTHIKQLLTLQGESIPSDAQGDPAGFINFLRHQQGELARLQRQLLLNQEPPQREVLQYALALHDLICAPDTLLISLREGLESSEKLLQLTAARYLERLLPSKPLETLELYQRLLQEATSRNVRRTVAKALPALLRCLEEAPLSIRTLARAVITKLAADPDLYIRRAVADHAMHLFYRDREFLLLLLRQLHQDADPAIRHRLQPIVMRLAEVWLTWYAETAGLMDGKRDRKKAVMPFGE